MKSKMLVILSTLIMALGLMAQNATQTPAAPSGDSSKGCACCKHDQADGKMSCCGKDGKCGQMSKDGKDATMSHDEMMSKDGKSGMKCPMMAKNDEQGRQDVVLRQRWWLLQRRQVRHGQRRQGLLRRKDVRTSGSRGVTNFHRGARREPSPCFPRWLCAANPASPTELGCSQNFLFLPPVVI